MRKRFLDVLRGYFDFFLKFNWMPSKWSPRTWFMRSKAIREVRKFLLILMRMVNRLRMIVLCWSMRKQCWRRTRWNVWLTCWGTSAGNNGGKHRNRITINSRNDQRFRRFKICPNNPYGRNTGHITSGWCNTKGRTIPSTIASISEIGWENPGVWNHPGWFDGGSSTKRGYPWSWQYEIAKFPARALSRNSWRRVGSFHDSTEFFQWNLNVRLDPRRTVEAG